ncbi:MAG: DUF2851 family protein [Limisphaerales bacterium]
MNRVRSDLYARWRAHNLAADAFREEGDRSVPVERLLQQIWYHQRLHGDQLLTLDGRRLRVLHPGFWNREAGPDFRDAVVQFDTEPPCSGDIEIDRQPSQWHTHNHHQNPNYRHVILHVVWEAADAMNLPLPTLALKSVLDASLPELDQQMGSLPSESLPGVLRGRCCVPMRGLTEPARTDLLEQAALVRLQQKAFRHHARARQVGWDQTLWEGLFRALGYKHNVWPMQRLAELVFPLAQRPPRLSAFALQAVLLGVGNLLPDDLTRPSAGGDAYLRRVWDHWWRVREEFAEIIFPRRLWRFSGLRPANHPQRRLALAAHWLANRQLVSAKLEEWFTAPLPRSKWGATLREVLQVERDDFWSWHWTLRSRRLPAPQPLLGAARVTDLGMNVVLPWFWMRSVAGKNDALRRIAEERYLGWPKGQDNTVLRLARQRLLSGAPARSVRSAAGQQGLIQIVRDFCSESNAVCDGCRFPEFVQNLVGGE